MGDLSAAVRLAEEAEQALLNVNNFLLPFVPKYKALTEELGNPHHHEPSDFEVDTFVQIEGESFFLNAEEKYIGWGEYVTPTLNLPFAFVENPATYREKLMQEKKLRQDKLEAARQEEAKARILSLEAQLEKARKEAGLAD